MTHAGAAEFEAQKTHVKIDIVRCHSATAESPNYVTCYVREPGRIRNVVIGDPVYPRCGHWPHGIHEGVKSKSRLLSRITTHNRDFNNAIKACS